MKTLKDIKSSNSSTDDIEQMFIDQTELEMKERFKMVAREWIKHIDESEEEICDDSVDELCRKRKIEWIKHFFNLEEAG